MMDKARVRGVAKSTEPLDLLEAIEDAAQEYLDTHDKEPTHVWLHPTWGETIPDIEEELPYTVGYDPDLMGLDEFTLGGEDAMDDSPTTSMTKVPEHGNMWVQLEIAEASAHKIIDAAVRTSAKFEKTFSIRPTHIAFHDDFLPDRDQIEVGSGLQFSTTPPVPYPTWGYVGIPEIMNRKVEVSSTNVSSIQFFPDGDGEDTGTLFIAFKQRNDKPDVTYQYLGVPSNIYQGLLDSKSKGAYVNTHIKKQYKGEKLG